MRVEVTQKGEPAIAFQANDALTDREIISRFGLSKSCTVHITREGEERRCIQIEEERLRSL